MSTYELMKMQKFKARIELIGINPFVFVPGKILKEIFRQSGKDKGHIPVRGGEDDPASSCIYKRAAKR